MRMIYLTLYNPPVNKLNKFFIETDIRSHSYQVISGLEYLIVRLIIYSNFCVI